VTFPPLAPPFPLEQGPRALLVVQLNQLRPHPANPNRMTDEQIAKLAKNIAREQNYPPLVVRPHPSEKGCFEILDGHQRFRALLLNKEEQASCYVWPCDDITALSLLATLNSLRGQEDEEKRVDLLRDLTGLVSETELRDLLPENSAGVLESLARFDVNITPSRTPASVAYPLQRSLRFVINAADLDVVESALAAASGTNAQNRRSRALVAICRAYLEA
jgi:ParB-like chromosome segregation protein Spo0J